MFDDCPFSIFHNLKTPKDAVQIAFLIVESRLNLVIQTYQRFQTPDQIFKNASKLITEFVMKLPPIQWENVLTLLSSFPNSKERAQVLNQYSKTHKLFSTLFDYDVPRNQIPNNFKALVPVTEFETYVKDSLREFKHKDDWRNFNCLINAYTELKQWEYVCLVFIDLKYEQVRRVYFSDISDQQKFDKTKTYVEKIFKDNVPNHFKNEPSFQAAIFSEEIKSVCVDFFVKKNADHFDRILNENFLNFNPIFASENYLMLNMFYVNVALNICVYKYRTDKSPNSVHRIAHLLDLSEKFEKRHLSEKMIQNEAKKIEWSRLKKSNGDKVLEIRAVCLA